MKFNVLASHLSERRLFVFFSILLASVAVISAKATIASSIIIISIIAYLAYDKYLSTKEYSKSVEEKLNNLSEELTVVTNSLQTLKNTEQIKSSLGIVNKR